MSYKKPRKSQVAMYRKYMTESMALLREAQNQFDWADEDHIDEAITKLNNAEIMNDLDIKDIKMHYKMPIHKRGEKTWTFGTVQPVKDTVVQSAIENLSNRQQYADVDLALVRSLTSTGTMSQ